ncbi:hypothetical protein HGRIS_014042 [Hohenbuehelia grisea]|uniref:Uncharacterized protein n=1 Tax=Hohenbuehelia grisea TaxID=104357 RepID=A0ABR3JUB9_9AGAR
MAAFFAWGNAPNSFVVGKGSLLDYQNLPDEYAGKFKSYEWNAMKLSAFYTGPQGFHWASQPNSAWSARAPETLVPLLHTQFLSDTGPGRGYCQFVAFAPDGVSWFARFSSKTSLCGPARETLPATFRAIIADLDAHHPRQDACLDFVAFGAHDVVLVRFENGNSGMFLPEGKEARKGIDPGFVVEVEDRLKDGWTFGNRTTLCQNDSARWFIEWRRGPTAEFRFSTGEGEAAKEVLTRINKVLSGEGNNAAMVADHQAADMIAANSTFQSQLMIGRLISG